MVSPVNKNGSNIEVVFNVTGYSANLDKSALDGGKITYSAYRAFANPKGSPYSSQYFSTRASSGWQTESITPPREGPSFYATAGLDYQFKAFTDDLCSGWLLQDTPNSLLAPGAITGYPNLYRRSNCGAGAGGYEALTTGNPTESQSDFFPVVQGFSADGSTTFFAVKGKLTGNAQKNKLHTYEAKEEQLGLVCILPNESVTNCGLGSNAESDDRSGNVFHAASEDGQLVYWSVGPSGPLYVRSAGQSTMVASGPIRFGGAASDGSKAVYLSEAKLFEYDLLTKDNTLIAEGVQGVAGMSDDASVVYFVSTQNLAPGGVAGQPNLYMSRGGDEEFVAALAGDVTSLFSPAASTPVFRSSRVTPDGDQIVFMSRSSPTGYDNTDAVSGEADSEVFLYDATADGGAGELLCVSCNPSFSRPRGKTLRFSGVSNYWTAGWIPGWTNHLHASRVISDDGNRVFFNSFDALVARDQNKALDVYEWEALGAGECKDEASYGFVDSAGGCVNLISSGQSPQASEFVDASASGDDVFFKTYSSLVPYDPALVDIYDARVGGGFPNPPTPEKECEGEGCLPPPAPEPAHPTPQSQSFVGPGNQVAKPKPKPKKCPKGKHRVKRKGKYVCVKNKKAGKQNKSGRAGK